VSELDLLGRTPLAEGMKRQLDAALREIPEGKRGALLVIADENGARAVVAAKIGKGWKVAAGAGTPWRDAKPQGWVWIYGSW
jgi:Mg-chelatase subunit ChlD